jgi:hypothetical protein
LWTNNSLQGNCWNTDNIDDKIIKTEELKQAIKKLEYHLLKVTWIVNYVSMRETDFMRDYCFYFNKIFMMGEMPE